jgi:hypothetical protein
MTSPAAVLAAIRRQPENSSRPACRRASDAAEAAAKKTPSGRALGSGAPGEIGEKEREQRQRDGCDARQTEKPHAEIVRRGERERRIGERRRVEEDAAEKERERQSKGVFPFAYRHVCSHAIRAKILNVTQPSAAPAGRSAR